MDYPEYAEINGKNYKIDTDFRTSLKCFEIMQDDSIHNVEKIYAIIYLLFDFIPKDELIDVFFEKAVLFLQQGKTEEEQLKNEKDMDFIEDKKYIFDSFMSDYHLNLNDEKLHFWEYLDLIEGLTENCVLNKIRNIRTFDLSKVKDKEERRELIELKKRFKLKSSNKNKLTSEQKKNVNEFLEKIGMERRE